MRSPLPVMSLILPYPPYLGGRGVQGQGVWGQGGLGRGRGVGGSRGGLRVEGGRGHFIHLAIYCTTTWCFAPKGLRTINTFPESHFAVESFKQTETETSDAVPPTPLMQQLQILLEHKLSKWNSQRHAVLSHTAAQPLSGGGIWCCVLITVPITFTARRTLGHYAAPSTGPTRPRRTQPTHVQDAPFHPKITHQNSGCIPAGVVNLASQLVCVAGLIPPIGVVGPTPPSGEVNLVHLLCAVDLAPRVGVVGLSPPTGVANLAPPVGVVNLVFRSTCWCGRSGATSWCSSKQ